MTERPKTVAGLCEFYYDRFKPIYNHVQLLNKPPIEMFFEVNAAFDHLSRHWKYGEPEQKVIDSACRHLKRGCFDAFKIFVMEARTQYNALMQLDVGLIDNGVFQSRMINLFAEITAGAIQAREAEGDSRDESKWDHAFDLWEKVYANGVTFERDFFQSKKVEWAKLIAKKRTGKEIWRNRTEGVFASLAAAVIIWLLSLGYSAISTTGPKNDLPAVKKMPSEFKTKVTDEQASGSTPATINTIQWKPPKGRSATAAPRDVLSTQPVVIPGIDGR